MPVYLISGGLRRVITPIAQKLGIPMENVFANRLYFENGKKFNIFKIGLRCGKIQNIYLIST